MAERKRGLGRGIGALIPTSAGEADRAAGDPAAEGPIGGAGAKPLDVFFAAEGSRSDSARQGDDRDGGGLLPVPGARFAALNPDDILPNPRQPRQEFRDQEFQELVASVREFGVLQPVVVRPRSGALAGEPQYELVMGERRLRASKAAGLGTIPAVVRDTADDVMLRDALLENLHRADLNPIEEAEAYQQLLEDFGVTQEVLADRIGRSRPQIANTIRLLRLPEPVRRRVAAGVLSAGHARAILSVGDDVGMLRLADKIVNEELSVRSAEAAAALASGKRASGPTKPRAGSKQAHLDDLAQRIGDRLDTRVSIRLGAKQGRIVIDFATVADLNRIADELGVERN